MKIFELIEKQSWYRAIERSFFNTISRKLSVVVLPSLLLACAVFLLLDDAPPSASVKVVAVVDFEKSAPVSPEIFHSYCLAPATALTVNLTRQNLQPCGWLGVAFFFSQPSVTLVGAANALPALAGMDSLKAEKTNMVETNRKNVGYFMC